MDKEKKALGLPMNGHVALDWSDDHTDAIVRGVDHLTVADIDTHMSRVADNISRLGLRIAYSRSC